MPCIYVLCINDNKHQTQWILLLSRMHLQANYAPPVIPPIAHEACRHPDHTRDVYSSTIVTCKTSTSTRTCPFHTQPRRRTAPSVAASSTTSALRRDSNSEKLENWKKYENQQLRIRDSPPNRNMITNAAHTSPRLLHPQPQRLKLSSQHGRCVMEYVLHRLPGSYASSTPVFRRPP